MQNNPTIQDSAAERVLREIRSKRLQMRPKVYFVLKMVVIAAVSLAVLVVSIFLCGFIFFSISASSQPLLFGFGTHGFLLFFVLFPWGLLLADLALIILLEVLLRAFEFAYRVPALYMLLALLGVSILFSVIVEDLTQFHERLGRRADQNQLPLLGGWYEDAKHPPHSTGVCRCVVVHVGTSTIIVRDDWNTATNTPLEEIVFGNASDTQGFKPGDRLFIVGDEENGRFRPRGFRMLPPEFATTTASSTS